MKKLNENVSRNILAKLNESYEDNVDIVESTIAKNGEDYGVKSVEGKNSKILVKTNNGSYWLCECECGNVKSIKSSSLRRGEIQSCGCFRN